MTNCPNQIDADHPHGFVKSKVGKVTFYVIMFRAPNARTLGLSVQILFNGAKV